MPRPPDHSLNLLLIALLLFANAPLIANAQQKRLTQQKHALAPHGKSTFYEEVNHNSFDNHDVRAIATTLAPASERAVGAPPAKRSPGSSGGLSSRLSARSLQDWDVEDVVLLATVDGKIYARDRRTGAPRWELEADRSVVETIYHPRNKSIDGSTPVNDEYVWIVEPSQDGALYGYMPGVSFGVQKLPLTIKQLHELTPFVSDDIRYLVDRKTWLYTVDVSTGNIQKMFSAGSSAVLDEKSCRRVRGLESFEDEECPITGTLNLGRTEYTVQISSAVTSELIATIKYFEWGPNQRDRDLISQYATTKDNRYVYTRFNGEAMASHHLRDTERALPELLYTQKFSSPVAQVFDVVRPAHDESPDAPLITLPQPSAPMAMGVRQFDMQDRVFVNCTEAGSWYALSEARYPMVTAGASSATCLSEEYRSNMPRWKEQSDIAFKFALTGVHDLAIESQSSHGVPIPLIGGPEELILSTQADAELSSPYLHLFGVHSIFSASSLLLVVAILTFLVYPRVHFKQPHEVSVDIPKTPLSEATPSAELGSTVDDEATAPVPSEMVVDMKEASTTITEKEVKLSFSTDDSRDTDAVPLDDQAVQAEIIDSTQANPGKKKKAHRGNRGGRAQREKEKAKLAVQKPPTLPEEPAPEEPKPLKREVTIQPDVISKHAPMQDDQDGLHNLHVRFDRILGSGSGGTFVFEGKFEGRDVAVKRMLRQQYELASQEVSLLEQNDEHVNVIRYFCRREDENFLYIALELCQASLWDLFRDGRGNEGIEERQSPLRQEILQDPRRVLRQLAEGLNYLHSFRIVHRDIKPQNMLIAYPKKNNFKAFPRLVISDFGLCKTLPENVSTLVGTTGNAGTAGWMAPELISQPKDSSNNSHQSTTLGEPTSNRSDATVNGHATGTSGKVKRAVDIFSLGCVFFYVLTHGQHPFDDEEGWMALRERNIKNGRAKNLKALDLLGADTLDLIEWMLQHNPEERPTASQVLAHPFFWDSEDRLEFLSAASDRFDQEPRDGSSLTLKELEYSAEAVIPKALPSVAHSQLATHSHLRTNNPNEMALSMQLPIPEPNFLATLDRRFVETLGRQRKYDPAKLTDLLRALRNKHHHWDDMPDDVKQRVGEVPEGYLHFWESRFPGLVVRIWRVISKLGVSNERRFSRWYANKGNITS